jgi:hypothetical protein
MELLDRNIIHEELRVNNYVIDFEVALLKSSASCL